MAQADLCGQEPIKITGIIEEEIGLPRNDGTRGSALYEVPFRLSQEPAADWREFFVHAWNNPSRFTSMHRPGIASVIGSTVILDGTTVEEVEQYHKETLLLAVDEANRRVREHRERIAQSSAREAERVREHREHVVDVARKIDFGG